jgi:hypothetical protein
MKSRPDRDDSRGSSPDSRAEQFFANFLRRHPRFFAYVGIALLVLVVLAIVAVKVIGRDR